MRKDVCEDDAFARLLPLPLLTHFRLTLSNVHPPSSSILTNYPSLSPTSLCLKSTSAAVTRVSRARDSTPSGCEPATSPSTSSLPRHPSPLFVASIISKHEAWMHRWRSLFCCCEQGKDDDDAAWQLCCSRRAARLEARPLAPFPHPSSRLGQALQIPLAFEETPGLRSGVDHAS